MSDEAFAEFFLSATDSRNAYLAHSVAGAMGALGDRRLLDIGGGSGIYACAIAAANPDLHATVFEKAPVDGIARRAIERRELSHRVDVVTGDMLVDPLPTGYDLHLYSNVVHDWEEDCVLRLMRASFAALPPGGAVVVHDAMLGPDGAEPRAVAEYSVLLMAFTSGRCYSRSELTELLERAGFGAIAHTPTVVNRDLLTGVKPG
jgi:predicted O-methyltransferase YrrM